MRLLKAFKYISPLSFYLLAYFSFAGKGWTTWLPLIYAWMLIPLLELFLSPDERNIEAAESLMAKKTKFTISCCTS